MEQLVRELRIKIDTLINSVKLLNSSREVSLCHTDLQRGKHWLGLVLKELGTKTPYPGSSDPKIEIIEPQAEHTTSTIKLRAAIEDVMADYQPIIEAGKEHEGLANNESDMWLEYLSLSHTAMIESKLWLGWELNRIHELQNPSPNYNAGSMAMPLI